MEETTMEQVGGTIHRLLMTDPFFCYFLSGIDRVIVYPEDNDRYKPPFAAVGKSDNLSYMLIINSQGWETLKQLGVKSNLPEFCSDVLKHEALHIAYTHPTMMHMFKYHEIANIAMDLEINQYLKHITEYNKNKTIGQNNKEIESILEDDTLSEGDRQAKLDKLFKEADPVFMTLDSVGWPNDQNKGSLYYYNKLIAAADKYDQKMEGQGKGQGKDGKGEKGNGKGQGKGKEKGGSDSGSSDEMEDNVGEMISKMRANKDFADAIRKMLGDGSWKDFNANEGSIDNDIINDKIKQTIKDILERNQNIGNLPVGIKAQLDKMLEDKVPVTDWKRTLSVLTAKAISYYTKTTRRKPNKRNPDFAAIKIKSLIRIFVTVDTSGSMSDNEIREVLAEVENIRKTNRAEIDLGECDAELYVKEICKVGRKTIETKNSVSGRGGTSVQPAIDYVNANRELYTLFVYLTDGWVPTPERLCSVPMITVITKHGTLEEDCQKLRDSKGFGYVLKTK